MVELIAKTRAGKSGVDKTEIMAVMYGKGVASQSLTINKNDFNKIYAEAGESASISLNVDGKIHNALIHAVDRDPVKYTPSHVDFYVVSADQKLHVNVPVVYTGDAPAVKAGLLLVKVMHEVPLYGAQSDIPHELTVDLSTLVDEHSVVRVSDLSLPKGVTLYHSDGNDVVISVSLPTEEKEEETRSLEDIEVAKKGKKEEEEK